MRKGELESRLIVLVTLGLVAFGLVMVYSATSAAAALGNGDPSSYLKRQAAYALLGICLLIGASRLDYRKLKALAPPLVLTSLGLCLLVLVVGTQVNGARRWLAFGPATFQPLMRCLPHSSDIMRPTRSAAATGRGPSELPSR